MLRKILLSALIGMVCATALWWWHSQAEVAAWRPALSSREIATRVLAEDLAKRYPGSKALIVGNPFARRSGQTPEIYAFDKAEVRGLEKGFGTKPGIKEVFPELRPEFLERPDSVFVDPKTTTPLSFLVAEDSFEKLSEANAGFDLMVSLIGFPINLRQSRLWLDPGKPRIALLLPDWRLVGNREVIREAVKSEKIAAAVVARAGNTVESDAVLSDYRSEFDRQFLLVTKDNLDELLQTYPHLF